MHDFEKIGTLDRGGLERSLWDAHYGDDTKRMELHLETQYMTWGDGLPRIPSGELHRVVAHAEAIVGVPRNADFALHCPSSLSYCKNFALLSPVPQYLIVKWVA